MTAGEDRVTLMTSRALRRELHRLLVSGVRAEIPNGVPVPEDAQGINTTAVALGVLGRAAGDCCGSRCGRARAQKRRAAQRAAVAAAVTLDAGAAAGEGGNGWTAGASGLRSPSPPLLQPPRLPPIPMLILLSIAGDTCASARVGARYRSKCSAFARFPWSFARTAALSRTCRTTRWSSFPPHRQERP